MKDAPHNTDVIEAQPVRPVVIIGAGPIGLAAAAHLLARGLTPLVLEKGATAGDAMLRWGHVRVFTPWRFIIDEALGKLLEASAWARPDDDDLPTGQDIVEQYLRPAARTDALREVIVYGANVVGVSKTGLGRSSSQGRDDAPFAVHYTTGDGGQHVIEAAAVLDASGTWSSPNPIGADGLPVPGERDNAGRIAYGMPDCAGQARSDYAGRRTLVLGGGHSAVNVVLDLANLQGDHEGTAIYWGLRRNNLDRLLGGALNDLLPARAALGVAAKQAIARSAVALLTPVHVQRIVRSGDALSVELSLDGATRILAVDRIVVCTGFRPDLEMLRELRLDLDGVVEAPVRLAPLIDPNVHSCGTVPAHGVDELSHPDRNLFIVGMKAYGRAPTFLMRTGYAQISSIADHLAAALGAGDGAALGLAGFAGAGLDNGGSLPHRDPAARADAAQMEASGTDQAAAAP